MKILIETLKDFIRFFDVRTQIGIIRMAILAVVLIGIILFITKEEDIVETNAGAERLVEVAQISSLNSSNQIGLVGTVKAVSQAIIQSESTGRVTEVTASIGDTVAASQILGTLENASEFASLLQAEGAYEAALAAAQQSDISVEEAQNGLESAENAAVTAYVSSYNSANDIVLTTLDDFYGEPESSLPGIRLAGKSFTNYLNNERVAFNSVLSAWQQSTLVVDNSSIDTQITEAIQNIDRLVALIDTFIILVNDEDNENRTIDGVTVESYNETLTSERAVLNSTKSSLQGSLTTLQNARETLSKAQISGTSAELSAANAQVKQALGSLRSAQANYEKTIFRSPISGVVNELNISIGDFVSNGFRVGLVANNNALEITTYVSENDRDKLSIGKEVLINERISGIVSAISPGVDSATRKIEVKISTNSEELINGDTVRISIETNGEEESSEIILPITALKVETDRVIVFTVNDESLLTANPVEVGRLLGENILILEGIDRADSIVLDARGLNEGDQVVVQN